MHVYSLLEYWPDPKTEKRINHSKGKISFLVSNISRCSSQTEPFHTFRTITARATSFGSAGFKTITIRPIFLATTAFARSAFGVDLPRGTLDLIMETKSPKNPPFELTVTILMLLPMNLQSFFGAFGHICPHRVASTFGLVWTWSGASIAQARSEK